MKDFISKVTFGFLMAQLLPGAIVVFSISCTTKVLSHESLLTLKKLLTDVGQDWFKTTLSTVAFIFIAVAIGMIIHGLNWTILAWLENREDPRNPEAVRETRWHKWCFLMQLLLSPFLMGYEILNLLFKAPNINCLTMDENISNIKKDFVGQFLFLQEFYLHFGQFYAHTAYSFLITVVCSLICCIDNFSWSRCGITIGLYFLTSVFFLLGRIQLGSLFKAETNLREQSTSTPAGQ